ncbi:MAG: DUF2169 domain-containing protein [Xanthomonadales bacterium]|nr:DUF2169 domain-containing protein [Xanthomonadales bacterium]
MQLINTTSVPVSTDIVGTHRDQQRALILTAKATFTIAANGEVQLDRDSPYPLYNEDQPTELGIQPRDNLPRLDPVFEVMLLAKAYPPLGQAVTQMKVSLRVGDDYHEIDVLGDRVWQGEGDKAKISAPNSFESMPLTWEHAFGGAMEVLVDREAVLEVSSPMNTAGKGFDHISRARELGDVFQCPEGYPQFENTRFLPNLEDPTQRVMKWDDDPLPICWAPVDHSSGLIIERFRRSCERRGEGHISMVAPEMLHRAHPDWVIQVPDPGAMVRLEGACSTGVLEFCLPELRVVADFKNAEAVSQLELLPRSLLLLAEERKFVLIYRCVTKFAYTEGLELAARIRLLKGWSTKMDGVH